jgi:hypothetical protein
MATPPTFAAWPRGGIVSFLRPISGAPKSRLHLRKSLDPMNLPAKSRFCVDCTSRAGTPSHKECQMKLASTRIALLGAVLGAAGALTTLPMGNDAAAGGVSGAVSAAAGAVGGVSAGVGHTSASVGAASATSADATSGRQATKSGGSWHVDGAKVANSTDADVSVTGPHGGTVDVDVDSTKAASLYRFGSQATGKLGGSTDVGVNAVSANGNAIGEDLSQSGGGLVHVGQFRQGTIIGATANDAADSALLATTKDGSAAAADLASDAATEAHFVRATK